MPPMHTKFSQVVCAAAILSVLGCGGRVSAQTDFIGGEVTEGAAWTAGLPSPTNPGTVAENGTVSADVTGMVVTQTAGTITINSGVVNDREIRSTWILQGGVFQRTNGYSVRLGGLNPAQDGIMQVEGGVFQLTDPTARFILYSPTSVLNMFGGLATAPGNFTIHGSSNHTMSRALHFGSGDGRVEVDGFDFADPGYINFTAGSGGSLILRSGTITGASLPVDVDTFEALWTSTHLRLDDANTGAFSDHFFVEQVGVQRTLRLSLPISTVFLGGEITQASDWSNGLSSTANPGRVDRDGTVTADIDGAYVTQTNGTVTLSGTTATTELRHSTWRLEGGSFTRSDTGQRIGGGTGASALLEVVGGQVQITGSGNRLILYGGSSMVRVTGGEVLCDSVLHQHGTPVHDESPILEFGPGDGLVAVSGLQFDKPDGYINFISGTAGILTLTAGTITGSALGAETDTFAELWGEGRLRIDGGHSGVFTDFFTVLHDGDEVTLVQVPSPPAPALRFLSANIHADTWTVTWNVATNKWLLEGFQDLTAGTHTGELLLHSPEGGPVVNAATLPVTDAGKALRLQTGLQVLSGFVDTNLVRAIKEVGLYPAGPVGYVVDRDVLGLTDLFAAGYGIVDFNGLDQMPDLDRLDLSGDGWSDTAAFEGFPAIVTYALSGNVFPDGGGVAGLLQAVNLNLAECGMSDLTGLELLGNLQFLNLYSNGVSSVSALSGLTSLVWLELGDNQLTGIDDLAALTGLSWIGLAGNQLTDISGLVGMNQLRVLGLAGNRLSDLTGLGGLTGLTWLNLEGNALTGVSALASLVNVRGLDLSGNALTTLTGVETMTALHWINLDDNQLTDLAALVTNASNGGLGDGGIVSVRNNPLSPTAINTQIPALEAQGITVWP